MSVLGVVVTDLAHRDLRNAEDDQLNMRVHFVLDARDAIALAHTVLSKLRECEPGAMGTIGHVDFECEASGWLAADNSGDDYNACALAMGVRRLLEMLAEDGPEGELPEEFIARVFK